MWVGGGGKGWGREKKNQSIPILLPFPCGKSNMPARLVCRDGPSGGPRPGSLFFFFFLSYSIFYFCSWASLLPNQSSYPNSNSNYLTQKLNKNNKNIYNGDCILAKKQFYHQRTKKSCVIGEVKAKFFATIVNWYKC